MDQRGIRFTNGNGENGNDRLGLGPFKKWLRSLESQVSRAWFDLERIWQGTGVNLIGGTTAFTFDVHIDRCKSKSPGFV